jgi:hypothetical protein
VAPSFIVLLITILLIGSSKIDRIPKLFAVHILTIAVAIIPIYFFGRDGVTVWGMET